MYPITAILISTEPSSVGDYLEFTFTGDFDIMEQLKIFLENVESKTMQIKIFKMLYR